MEGKTTASKIKETIAKIGELQAVKRHYDSTMEEYDNILDKKDKIEDKMIKELEDINKLEKLGVKSIFYNVLGSKEEQLEKERQEYLQATLKHKEVLNAIEVVKYEKELLEKKLVVIDDLEVELEKLKAIREAEIMASPGALRNELKLIDKKMDELQQYNVELGEAKLAGNRTLESLDIVYKNMKKAKDWGNWDMVQNDGRRHTKSMKHNAIDRAMHEVSRSKLLLRTFNKELRDVGYSNQRLALQVSNIDRFPGMIFDNLISDWIIQNKIKSVLSTVGNLMDDVQLTVQSILKDSRDADEEYTELDEKRHRLLEEN
ncbi:MAG: hypothetical protein AAGA77_17375 [Bacteroidota bacterium]